MKVTVCELPNDAGGFEGAWTFLRDQVKEAASDLVLLPEMAFFRWLSASRAVDPADWSEAVNQHDAWLGRLGELGVEVVMGTRPVIDEGRRFNEGFVWRASGLVEAHRKVYLPNEAGFWEANWYEPGPPTFELVEVGSVRIGFLICTELWFNRHGRDYMREGIDLLLCPRATLMPSREKWIAGGRAAAVVSGAFCLSSNFSGAAAGRDEWGGAGWVIEPEEGEVLGRTTERNPILTVEIDLDVARRAKATYPRYVPG